MPKWPELEHQPRYHRGEHANTLKAKRRLFARRVRTTALTVEETVLEQRRIESVRIWVAVAVLGVLLAVVAAGLIVVLSIGLIGDALTASTLSVILVVIGIILFLVGALFLSVIFAIRFLNKRRPVPLMTTHQWQMHQTELIVGDMEQFGD